eukprot:1968752-Pyramimonas_sp.AAC.1
MPSSLATLSQASCADGAAPREAVNEDFAPQTAPSKRRLTGRGRRSTMSARCLSHSSQTI